MIAALNNHFTEQRNQIQNATLFRSDGDLSPDRRSKPLCEERGGFLIYGEKTPLPAALVCRATSRLRLSARFVQSHHVEKCKTGITPECVTPWAPRTDVVNAL